MCGTAADATDRTDGTARTADADVTVAVADVHRVRDGAAAGGVRVAAAGGVRLGPRRRPAARGHDLQGTRSRPQAAATADEVPALSARGQVAAACGRGLGRRVRGGRGRGGAS